MMVMESGEEATMARRDLRNAKKPKGPVKYEPVDMDDVPIRMSPSYRQWWKMIAEAVKTGQAMRCSDLGGRTERAVLSSIGGFVKKFPNSLRGGKLRTRTEGGKIWVWVEGARPVEGSTRA